MNLIKTETYTYYSNDQMATKTDRNRKITNYKYDIHARLLSKTIDKEEVSYSYDPNGYLKVPEITKVGGRISIKMTK